MNSAKIFKDEHMFMLRERMRDIKPFFIDVYSFFSQEIYDIVFELLTFDLQDLSGYQGTEEMMELKERNG